MSRLARRPHVSHRDVVTEAKARPGEWVLVGPYRSHSTATSMASAIRNGRRDMTMYKPLGAYETCVIRREFDTELHVRFNPGGAA